MNISKYPNDFFNFQNGVDVNNKEINQWIKDCIRTMQQDKNREYSYCCTGNSLVIILRAFSDECPECDRYEIFVTKNYQRDTLYRKDLYIE